MSALFDQFAFDELPAIEQLRTAAGGELSKHLDASLESLALLDTFLANLTATADWSKSEIYEGMDAVAWFAVRVAYYLKVVLEARHGCEWREAPDGQPVIWVGTVEIAPLEVALAAVRRELTGGLHQFVHELEEAGT